MQCGSHIIESFIVLDFCILVQYEKLTTFEKTLQDQTKVKKDVQVQNCYNNFIVNQKYNNRFIILVFTWQSYISYIDMSYNTMASFSVQTTYTWYSNW